MVVSLENFLDKTNERDYLWGIHAPELTQKFVEGLGVPLSNRANSSNLRNILIFPTQDYLALAAFQILQFARSPWRSQKNVAARIHQFQCRCGWGNWGSLGMAAGGHVKAFFLATFRFTGLVMITSPTGVQLC